MSDRNMIDVDPRFASIVDAVLNKSNLALAPSKAIITITWRDAQDQNAAAVAGLSKAVAGQSPHNCVSADDKPCARAVDFAIIDPQGTYVADGSDPRYGTVGAIAVSMGAEFGGDWTLEKDGCAPDFDHIQMANWREVTPYSSAA